MSGLTGKFSEAEQSIESSGSNLAATGQQLEDIGEKANKALEIFGQLTEEIRGPMVDAMKAGFGEQALSGYAAGAVWYLATGGYFR